jgi:hypothetical protein
VNLPDGSLINEGDTFNKIWRMKNTGSCTWDTGYRLVFVDGAQMNAPSTVSVPRVVPPGGIVDITVPMIAPNTMGVYRSRWQMSNQAGVKFGPVVETLIQVPPGPNDPPVITRFEVFPTVIDECQSATLRWEYVNGTFARIYPDGRAVGPSGSLVVKPCDSTDYRLVVNNNVDTVESSVSLEVRPGPTPIPTPATPTSLTITAIRADGFDFAWNDVSSNEQGFRLYNTGTSQVLATFAPNVVNGSVGGLNCGTPYSFRLVAFNQTGESFSSNTVQATTSACGG